MIKVVLFSIFSLIFSQTDISGEIGGTTLTVDGSPYTATADLTVAPYDTLNIDAGVEIIFNTGLKLLVNGQLNVNGTEQDSVIFKGLDDNDWQGIQFEYATDEGNISYADIKHTTSHAIYSYYSQDITIDNTSITDFNDYGIHINDTFSEINLQNMLIQGGGSDTYIYTEDTYLFIDNLELNAGGASKGINFSGTGSFEITNSNISGASNHGIAISGSNYNHIIENCIIQNNSTGIVIGYNTSASIDNSQIINNNSYGIHISGDSSLNVSNSLFQNNNSYGIYIDGSSTYIVDTCEFSSNGNGFYAQSSSYTPRLIQNSNFYNNNNVGISSNNRSQGRSKWLIK